MKIEHGKDYAFRFLENEGYHIEINSGEFEGVKFKYGQTKLEEDEEKGEASLNFEYDVVDDNGFGNLQQNEEFKDTIGKILISIIEENIQKYSEETNED